MANENAYALNLYQRITFFGYYIFNKKKKTFIYNLINVENRPLKLCTPRVTSVDCAWNKITKGVIFLE